MQERKSEVEVVVKALIAKAYASQISLKELKAQLDREAVDYVDEPSRRPLISKRREMIFYGVTTLRSVDNFRERVRNGYESSAVERMPREVLQAVTMATNPTWDDGTPKRLTDEERAKTSAEISKQITGLTAEDVDMVMDGLLATKAGVKQVGTRRGAVIVPGWVAPAASNLTSTDPDEHQVKIAEKREAFLDVAERQEDGVPNPDDEYSFVNDTAFVRYLFAIREGQLKPTCDQLDQVITKLGTDVEREVKSGAAHSEDIEVVVAVRKNPPPKDPAPKDPDETDPPHRPRNGGRKTNKGGQVGSRRGIKIVSGVLAVFLVSSVLVSQTAMALVKDRGRLTNEASLVKDLRAPSAETSLVKDLGLVKDLWHAPVGGGLVKDLDRDLCNGTSPKACVLVKD